jgi:large subunit ribosomal protein L1
MPRHGKKYVAAKALVDRTRRYSIEDALQKVKETAYAKFDESIDLAVRLNVNPKYSDQMVRGACVLPKGSGKEVRVLVFAKGDKEKEAKQAGADFVGAEDLVERIQQGWFGFDYAIASPDMMGLVGKIGKLLGPRGLMPNPKSGTVTMDVARAVKEAKSGKVEFKVEKAGIIHTTIGRKSFSVDDLKENIAAVMETLQKLRPATVKGQFIKSIAVSTTMGPGVKIDTTEMESLQRR